MAKAEFGAGGLEGMGFVAGAIVGHDPFHLNAHGSIPGDGGPEVGDGADGLLVRMDLGE